MIKLQHHCMKNLSRRAIVGYFMQQMLTRRLRYTRRCSPVKLWSCASRDGFGRVGSQSKACYVLFILKVDRFTDLIWQREATALKPTFWPLSVQMREPNLRRNWICALGNKLNSRSRTFQWDQWAGKLWSVCVINFFPSLRHQLFPDLVPHFLSTELPTLMWSCPKMEPLQSVTRCYYLLTVSIGEYSRLCWDYHEFCS
jgi:hypothetical protein